MTTHVLVARLDSLGDVLVSGPAVRAVAEHADRVTMLVGPRGAAAARLLPGVDEVLVWNCPWIAAPPPAVDRADVDALIDRLAASAFDAALILTSFHQSTLPTALVLRLAGVRHLAGVSPDYPGDLLRTRLTDPPDAPEPVRMLAIAAAAGYPTSAAQADRLRIIDPGPAPSDTPAGAFVAVHPGVDAPARGYPLELWADVVAELTAAGRTVVLTGSPDEAALTARLARHAAAGGAVLDLGGRTDVAGLAAVLTRAEVVVSANTGPAHLAAAVGTPVVSLFAPVVPALRWAPHGVARVVLGDQDAACRDTRARECPIAGHPCLRSVTPAQIAAAVDELAGAPAALVGGRRP